MLKTNTCDRQTGSVELRGGVLLKWDMSRYGHVAEDGDEDVRSKYNVSISCDDADYRDAMSAAAAGNRLVIAAKTSPAICPQSDMMMWCVGIDESGSLLWQIYRGDRKCDVCDGTHLANLDPKNYSDGGDVAMRSVAFMRDVARLAEESESISGLRDDILVLSRTVGRD